MKVLGIIPARYESSRFPGKALAQINGKTMIQSVYNQARKSSLLDEVIVVTDDQRIFDEVTGFEGQVMMSRNQHRNGTERCAEVLDHFTSYAYVVNVQCDEPFLKPELIDAFESVIDDRVELATLATPIRKDSDLANENEVKVVVNQQNEALYFSRNVIPYVKKSGKYNHFKHLGIYAYREDVLKKISRLPESPLEKAEGLEQLRWMDHGYRIRVLLTEYDSKSINRPEDLNL